MRSDIDLRPAPPVPALFNLAAWVLAAGQATPDRIALRLVGPTGAERWSFGRLTAAVRGTGAGLLAAGLVPGERLLMRLGNTPDFPIVFLGAVAAGILPVPTSAQLSVPEITRIAADIAPAAIAAAPGLALPEAPGVPVLNLPALRAMHALAGCAWDMGPPDRPGYIVYTSGTSGVPRAVVHAHRAVLARRMMWDGWYGLTAADRMLHAGALNWTYTLGTGLLDPWTAGASALIPAPGVEPAALPLLLCRHDATLFAAAPGLYRQMLKQPDWPALPALRHGLAAGERMPEATRAAWTTATGTPVFEAFGMSEISTFLSACPDRPAPAGASGWVQPGRRVALLGPDGSPTPRGTPGVIAVHRTDPGLFLHYWNAPEATAARHIGDWFVTGDIGVMDAEGAVTHLGRDDDMMNAGGVRVSPVEVEEALTTHPAIAEAAACEVRLRADVSVIAAFYTAPAALDEGTLAAHVAPRLARYKQPRLYLWRESLPRNANGKLARKALRAEWEAANAPV